MQNTKEWQIKSPSPDLIKDLSRITSEVAWVTEGKRLPEEVALAGVNALFTHPHYGFFIIAVLNGRVIGSLNMTYEYNAQLGKRIYWIQNIYVEPEYRSKGVFRSLFNETIRRAREEDSPCVKLYADRTNEKAHAVYHKLGMVNNQHLIYEKEFSFGDEETFDVSKHISNKNLLVKELNSDDLQELANFKSVHLIGNTCTDELNLEGLRLSQNCKAPAGVYIIRENDQIVGVVSFFSEWSDWRSKLLHWIYDIKIDGNLGVHDHPEYLKNFLALVYDQIDKDSMGAFRVKFIRAEPKLIDALVEFGLKESHYYIFEIPTN